MPRPGSHATVIDSGRAAVEWVAAGPVEMVVCSGDARPRRRSTRPCRSGVSILYELGDTYTLATTWESQAASMLFKNQKSFSSIHAASIVGCSVN